MINLTNPVIECVTCAMKRELLVAEFKFLTRAGIGILLAGCGILALALIFSFRNMKKKGVK